jgi:predicted nucleic acid-binding protein
MVHKAIETSRMAQLSYWDALTIEAAASAGCDRVLTEDLATGSIIRGVRIDNPFSADDG